MQELLWLLLPVAAASGWLAARRSNRRALEQSRLHSSAPSYIKGLNFLLNEQPDKAIDFFVKMLEVDSETVETHLALGNLFRRRGEVDRAIRIHQNLIARPTLNRDQRAQALLELGQDYMSAGLYDRAENLFQELVDLNLNLEQSLSNLKVIYQHEKDWEQCLKVAKRLEQVSGQSQRTERAHYYCELAERASTKGDASQASGYLKKAQMCDADSVRATLLQGRMEIARSSWKPALRTLKKIKRQDPAYLPEALELLKRCYRELGQLDEYLSYLERSYASYPSEALAVALASELEQTRGRDAAIDFLTRHLSDRPGLEVAEYLLRLNPCNCGPREDGTDRLLQQTVENLLEQRSAYQCGQCGFSMKTLHWQCPSCKSWGSVKPQGGAEEERG